MRRKVKAAAKSRPHRPAKSQSSVRKRKAKPKTDTLAEIPPPSEPRIIDWEGKTVQTPEGEQQVFAPRERPWASVRKESLADDDIRGLLRDLAKEAERRGLDIEELLKFD
jgi:hypothetical protein